jgi:2-oxoglutaroyl-CoA hydrolase
MNTQQASTDARLQNLDGFRVEIDAGRERGDVILARPPMNTISMSQRDELRRVFEALDEDPRVRIIVLRAEGEHFSSGGYIRGFLEASPEHVSKLAWNIAAPARCTKPVIAANRGYCFGVGFEISLACDFRIVSETCFYALPEQKLGQIPGSGGSARLHKIVGITRTKHIVMRSNRISGRQALEWGIATECVPEGHQRFGGRHSLDCHRARGALLQPAPSIGRLQGGRGGLSRKAGPEVPGQLTDGCGLLQREFDNGGFHLRGVRLASKGATATRRPPWRLCGR